MNSKSGIIDQLLLIGILAIAFLFAALGLYLTQDLASPLPWAKPSLSPTLTRVPPTATHTSTREPTSTPTRRPTYTPRNTSTQGSPAPGSLTALPSGSPQPPGTDQPPPGSPQPPSTGQPPPGSTQPATTSQPDTGSPQPSSTLQPGETPQPTPTGAQFSITPSPTSGPTEPGTTATPTSTDTETLTPGEDTPTPTETSEVPTETLEAGTETPTPTITPTELPGGYVLIEGRVLLNGQPAANVALAFEGNDTYDATTDSEGKYVFGVPEDETDVFIIFRYEDNQSLTPTTDVTIEAWLEGEVPDGATTLTLPDMEIGLLINSQRFELTSPANGATYQGSAISASNPVPFAWNIYPGSGTVSRYDVFITTRGDIDDSPSWSFPTQNLSASLTSSIPAGQYWAAVRVVLESGDFNISITSRPNDLNIN
ncbi:MAG: hypothetical protein JW726_01965 [Anaerolineales bacterium]|nr:hypothetical protein [Anaerolineales bacterium]